MCKNEEFEEEVKKDFVDKLIEALDGVVQTCGLSSFEDQISSELYNEMLELKLTASQPYDVDKRRWYETATVKYENDTIAFEITGINDTFGEATSVSDCGGKFVVNRIEKQVEEVTEEVQEIREIKEDVDYAAIGRKVMEECLVNANGVYVKKDKISDAALEKDALVRKLFDVAAELKVSLAKTRELACTDITEHHEKHSEDEVPGTLTLRTFDGTIKVQMQGDRLRFYTKTKEGYELFPVSL